MKMPKATNEIASKLLDMKEVYADLVGKISVFNTEEQNQVICDKIDILLNQIERFERTLVVRSEAARMRILMERP